MKSYTPANMKQLLKFYRASNEITMEELADRLEMNRATLSRVENGHTEFRVSEAKRFAELLGISLLELIEMFADER